MQQSLEPMVDASWRYIAGRRQNHIQYCAQNFVLFLAEDLGDVEPPPELTAKATRVNCILCATQSASM